MYMLYVYFLHICQVPRFSQVFVPARPDAYFLRGQRAELTLRNVTVFFKSHNMLKQTNKLYYVFKTRVAQSEATPLGTRSVLRRSTSSKARIAGTLFQQVALRN
jgi:hypothetical protein